MTNHIPMPIERASERIIVEAIKATVLTFGGLAVFGFWAVLGGVVVVAMRHLFF